MQELPASGEIRIIDRSELEHYQNEGWRAIGLTHEDTMIESTEEMPCQGGSNSNTCKHGYSQPCHSSDFVARSHKVQKALIVIARSEESVLAELSDARAAILDIESELSKRRDIINALRVELDDARETIAQRDATISALKSDVSELNSANERVCEERRTLREENTALRAHVHADAMAKVTRASEAMLTGDPVHPLAFFAYLDSLENITAQPEEYLWLLRDWTERRVIEEKRDDQDRLTLVIKYPEKIREGLRALDARKRLGIVDDDQEVAF